MNSFNERIIQQKNLENLQGKGYTEWQRRLWEVERFFDKHNHLMEFIRTLLAFIVLTLQIFILTKLG
jgi:hypothetical protein